MWKIFGAGLSFLFWSILYNYERIVPLLALKNQNIAAILKR
jgi:hypothetical protein